MGFSDEACIGFYWKSARYETTIPLHLGMGCDWGEICLLSRLALWRIQLLLTFIF
jgi:hypothetical protein